MNEEGKSMKEMAGTGNPEAGDYLAGLPQNDGSEQQQRQKEAAAMGCELNSDGSLRHCPT